MATERAIVFSRNGNGGSPNGSTATTPIVALGGSAGSFKGLKDFFRVIPADCGLAFVLITHLDPKYPSTLPLVVRHWTAMRAVHASNHLKIEPNCVYVIPPGQLLRLSENGFRLSSFQPSPGSRRAIDTFFSSVAEIRGRNAAAVLFSGADTDGSTGIAQVKEAGGLTIAQKPEEASHPLMVDTAIATGKVDHVLSVAEIPAKLLKHFGNRPKSAPQPSPSFDDLEAIVRDDNGTLREILSSLREQTGHDFAPYRQQGLLRRISHRMQVNFIETLPDYYAFLISRPAEGEALVQDFLISVTGFFRDPAAFKALEAELPELFDGKGLGDVVRVWVPGCATGEEVFSVAMLLREHALTLKSPPAIQIFGTDMDPGAIQVARAGMYPESIAKQIEPGRLAKFFTREARGYRVRRELREMVLFAAHNILKDAPFAQMDLISCRNLLIYLSTESQKRIFSIFHFALRPEKLLFLGPAEMVDRKSNRFEIIDKKHRLYRRRPGNRGSELILDSSALRRSLELSRATNGPVIPARTFAKRAPKKEKNLYTKKTGETVSSLKAHLKYVLKEHEASMAELMAGNQELQAINDELRSTTEELDISRQEMQSVNEELSAVNQELSVNLEDLNRANSDLQNFVNATESPTVFLDRELQIMRFTPSAVGLFKLIPTDVGRPLSDLQHRLDYPEMMSDAKQVADGATPTGREVRELEGPRSFLARVLPYRSPEEQIAGVVLTFADITERIRAEELVRERSVWLRGQSEALQTAVNGAPLETSLGVLVRAVVEALGEGTRAAIYLGNKDNTTLHHVVGMPAEYAKAVNGFKMGPESLARGSPTHRGEPALTTDAQTEPRWAPWRFLAKRFGYRGCWSFPIRSAAGNFIGALAIYSHEPRKATERQQELASLLANTAAIIIARHKESEVRKSVEQALRESEQRLQLMGETEAFGMIFFDQTGTLVHANEAFLQLTGYSHLQVQRRELTWRTFTPPEFVAESEAQLEKLARTGRIGPYEKEYICKDGSRRWMRFAGRDLGNGTIGELCVDITPQKKPKNSESSHRA